MNPFFIIQTVKEVFLASRVAGVSLLFLPETIQRLTHMDTHTHTHPESSSSTDLRAEPLLHYRCVKKKEKRNTGF